jgi:hypothetical protein
MRTTKAILANNEGQGSQGCEQSRLQAMPGIYPRHLKEEASLHHDHTASDR